MIIYELVRFISVSLQIFYNLFLENNFMTATRAIKKFAKKQHYKCKHKEFKLERNKVAMANKLQRAKNWKTYCAISILQTYYMMIGAFDNENEVQGRVVKCFEEGMTGSQIAKFFQVKKEINVNVENPFFQKFPKIKALLDKVIVKEPNDQIKKFDMLIRELIKAEATFKNRKKSSERKMNKPDWRWKCTGKM